MRACADPLWVGQAEPREKFPGLDELAALTQVACQIGGRVDILINSIGNFPAHGTSSSSKAAALSLS